MLKMIINPEKVGISIQPVENNTCSTGSIVARVNLNFGELKVKGYTLRISQYERKDGTQLFLEPPIFESRRGKKRKTVFIENKKKFNRITDRVIREWDNCDMPIIED